MGKGRAGVSNDPNQFKPVHHEPVFFFANFSELAGRRKADALQDRRWLSISATIGNTAQFKAHGLLELCGVAYKMKKLFLTLFEKREGLGYSDEVDLRLEDLFVSLTTMQVVKPVANKAAYDDEVLFCIINRYYSLR